MTIYSPLITHRLRYIADFISHELTGQPAYITDKQEEFILSASPRVNYSNARITPDEIWIKPHSLLFEKGIQPQNTDCFEWNDVSAFFLKPG